MKKDCKRGSIWERVCVGEEEDERWKGWMEQGSEGDWKKGKER